RGVGAGAGLAIGSLLSFGLWESFGRCGREESGVEMSPVGNESRAIVKLRFWILILATWVGFGAWHAWGSLADLALVTGFSLSATALSIWVLHLLDYFGKMELLPRRSDLLTIGMALPICGAILYGAMIAVFHHFPIPLVDIWVCLPLAAFAVFG